MVNPAPAVRAVYRQFGAGDALAAGVLGGEFSALNVGVSRPGGGRHLGGKAAKGVADQVVRCQLRPDLERLVRVVDRPLQVAEFSQQGFNAASTHSRVVLI